MSVDRKAPDSETLKILKKAIEAGVEWCASHPVSNFGGEGLYAQRINTALQDMPMYKGAVNALSNDSAVAALDKSMLLATGVGGTFNISIVVAQLIAYVFKLQEVKFPNIAPRLEDLINRAVDEFRAVCSQEKTVFHAVMVLPNFQSDIENHELGNGLSIRTMPVQLRDQLIEGGYVHRYGTLHMLSKTLPCSISVCRGDEDAKNAHKSADEQRDAVFEEFQEIMEALVLFKPGAVSLSSLILYGQMWPFYGSTSTRMEPKTMAWWPRYELNTQGVVEFGAFLSVFKSVRSQPHLWKYLKLPIRRLLFSKTKHYTEDRILDLSIGAEAFFLRKIDQELRYRFSVNSLIFAKYYLRSSTHDCQLVREYMKSVYDVRSAIAHGSEKFKDKLPEGFRASEDGEERYADDLEERMRQVFGIALRLLGERPEQANELFDWDTLLSKLSSPEHGHE